MAAPRKYKTNTLKTSSTKKSSSRSVSKKRPTSRVGSTKLAKKSFFKAWMAVPAVALVAIAGYFIVQFSQASSSSTMTYQRSSTCKMVQKKDGRNAKQCTVGQRAIYTSQKVGAGKYRVCYEVTAYTGVHWVLKIQGAGAKAGNRGDSDATKLSCTYELTMKKAGIISSELVTAANGGSNPDNFVGAYVTKAILLGTPDMQGPPSNPNSSGSSSGSSNSNNNSNSAATAAQKRDQMVRSFCNSARDLTSVSYRTLPSGRGKAKFLLDQSWKGPGSTECKKTAYSPTRWVRSTLVCYNGYKKTPDYFGCKPEPKPAASAARRPYPFCKDHTFWRGTTCIGYFKLDPKDSGVIIAYDRCYEQGGIVGNCKRINRRVSRY